MLASVFGDGTRDGIPASTYLIAGLMAYAVANTALGGLAIVLVIVMAISVTATDWGEVGERLRTTTDQLATILFNEYVLPFEIVSVLLLAAVIGGVFLARRDPGAGDPGAPGGTSPGGRPVEGPQR